MANNTSALDTINFNIPGGGPHTILLQSPLPAITQPVVINGYSEPGSAVNTAAVGTNAILQINLDGNALVGGGNGLVLAAGSAGSTIRGLAIVRFAQTTATTGGVGILIGNTANNGNHVIAGNFLGVLASNTTVGLGRRGIEIGAQAVGVQFGGPALADRNLVAGSGDGVVSFASSSSILNNDLRAFSGSAIRVGFGGLPLNGVSIRDNLITGSVDAGIRVEDEPAIAGVDIQNNRILLNGALGVDIGPAGLNPNDPGDLDAGPNGLQNHPEIDVASYHPASTSLRVNGRLNSAPGASYRIDFHVNPASLLPDIDEAAVPFASIASVTTDTTGLAVFELAQNSTAVAIDDRITVSATVLDTLSSSELSPPARVRRGQLVTTTADSGAGSLRQAIIDANLDVALDVISFAIPGAGPHEIVPLSALPAIISPLVINGYSQPGAIPNTLAQGSNAVLKIEMNGRLAGASADGLTADAPLTLGGLVINRFFGAGVSLGLLANDSVLTGNFIGTSVSGLQARSNEVGVEMRSSLSGTRFLQIGLPGNADRNIISGNRGPGILFDNIDGGGTEPFLLQVRNNLIGSSATLQPLGNGTGGNGSGIEVAGGSSQIRIGGALPGEANLIDHNLGPAVVLPNPAIGPAPFLIQIRGNGMRANAGLGIDLGGDGVTPNDPEDADGGPNGLQNAPQVLSAVIVAGSVTLAGVLDRPATPSAALPFMLDAYTSESCDPSGFGEGTAYLGGAVVEVGTDDLFVLQLPDPGVGSILTMTATSANGSTSEYSNCITPQENFSIGGNLTGLAAGNSVVMRNNGGDDLNLSANGPFSFSAGVLDGSGYAVSVQTQPTSPNQTCVVANGSGTVSGANVTDVSVSCTTNTYAIGGTLSGLPVGDTVTLRNNGGDDLIASANGPFSFATPITDGEGYTVTVAAQPASGNAVCAVSNGVGAVSGAAVTSVSVSCLGDALFGDSFE